MHSMRREENDSPPFRFCLEHGFEEEWPALPCLQGGQEFPNHMLHHHKTVLTRGTIVRSPSGPIPRSPSRDTRCVPPCQINGVVHHETGTSEGGVKLQEFRFGAACTLSAKCPRINMSEDQARVWGIEGVWGGTRRTD